MYDTREIKDPLHGTFLILSGVVQLISRVRCKALGTWQASNKNRAPTWQHDVVCLVYSNCDLCLSNFIVYLYSHRINFSFSISDFILLGSQNLAGNIFSQNLVLITRFHSNVWSNPQIWILPKNPGRVWKWSTHWLNYPTHWLKYQSNPADPQSLKIMRTQKRWKNWGSINLNV